jgi:hypothetical protein
MEVYDIHPSSLGNLSICPCYKNKESKDTRASDRGTLLHALVADATLPIDPNLPPEDQAAVQTCRDFVKALRNRQTVDDVLQQEMRLSVMLTPQTRLRGTLDLFTLHSGGRYGEIIDWKFGQVEVTAADRNLQLIAYAVMAFLKYVELQQLKVTCFCPCQGEEPTITTGTFDRGTLDVLRETLLQVILRSQDPNKKPCLNWSICQWCGAKASCPEMNQVLWATQKVTTAQQALQILSAGVLSAESRGKWQQVAEWAEDWAKQVKQSNLDAVLTEGAQIEGYAVTRRKGNMTIENTPLAAMKLRAMGYPEDIIMGACTMKLPALVQGAHAWKGDSEKLTRETLEDHLHSFIREGEPVVYLRKSNKKKQ